jgi:hypothetical protein
MQIQWGSNPPNQNDLNILLHNNNYLVSGHLIIYILAKFHSFFTFFFLVVSLRKILVVLGTFPHTI